MSDDTHLPAAKDVRDLLADLLGRDVQVTAGGPMVDPAVDFGAMVGVYVDRNVRLAALVLLDAVYAPGDPIPADVAQWILTFVRRCDLGVDVSGYGPGQFSLLVP